MNGFSMFSGNEQPNQEEDNVSQNVTQKSEEGNTHSKQGPPESIPYSRFQDVIREKNEAKDALDKMKASVAELIQAQTNKPVKKEDFSGVSPDQIKDVLMGVMEERDRSFRTKSLHDMVLRESEKAGAYNPSYIRANLSDAEIESVAKGEVSADKVVGDLISKVIKEQPFLFKVMQGNNNTVTANQTPTYSYNNPPPANNQGYGNDPYAMNSQNYVLSLLEMAQNKPI